LEDSDIISQARAGSKGAYRELLRKYSGLALAVAYARTGRKDMAQQAATNGLVEAARELAALPDAAPIAPWLASIVRSAAVKQRGGARRGSFTFEEAKNKVQRVLAESDSLAPGMKNELVLAAFGALSDEAREALCLRHLYSSDYGNIASAMTAEAGDTDKLIAGAREQLAEVVEPLFPSRL